MNDWKSEAGYEPAVRSTSEQESETVKGIQKFTFMLQQFPNNQALRTISQKRMLEMLDLTPEELKQVEDSEKQTIPMQEAQPTAGGQTPQLMSDIQNQMMQLKA